MIDLNKIAEETYTTALRRGKFVETDNMDTMHDEDHDSILGEVLEFTMSSEKRNSLHIVRYTESEEELVDVLITCLTALRRRKVNIEQIIIDKVKFNKTRDAGKTNIQ